MSRILKSIWFPALLVIFSIIVAELLHIMFYICTVLALADMQGRYRAYRKLIRNGRTFNPVHAKMYEGSFCGRQVYIAATAPYPTGKWYRHKGYKWYNLFPNGSPSIFFKWIFWSEVFGLRFK